MATQQSSGPEYLEFRSIANERPTVPAPASPEGVAQYEATIASLGQWHASLAHIVSLVSLAGSVQP